LSADDFTAGIRARARLPLIYTSAKANELDEDEPLKRITSNPAFFGGNPVIRHHRLAVEHVLGVLAARDSAETILAGYAWLEPEDVQACCASITMERRKCRRAPARRS